MDLTLPPDISTLLGSETVLVAGSMTRALVKYISSGAEVWIHGFEASAMIVYHICDPDAGLLSKVITGDDTIACAR